MTVPRATIYDSNTTTMFQTQFNLTMKLMTVTYNFNNSEGCLHLLDDFGMDVWVNLGGG